MAQAVTSVAGWRPWWRGMVEATAVSPAADRATQVLLDKVGGKLDGVDAAELDRDLAAVRA